MWWVNGSASGAALKILLLQSFRRRREPLDDPGVRQRRGCVPAEAHRQLRRRPVLLLPSVDACASRHDKSGKLAASKCKRKVLKNPAKTARKCKRKKFKKNKCSGTCCQAGH